MALINSVSKAKDKIRRAPSVCFNQFNNPICWFGDTGYSHNGENRADSQSYIFTMGINPSWEEFAPNRFTNNAGISTLELIRECDEYFYPSRNPYTTWFSPYQTLLQKHIAGVGYEGQVKHRLIHVDLIPYASKPIWNELEDEDINAALNLIDFELIADLIDYCHPIAIFSFGGMDKKLKALKGLSQNPNPPFTFTLKKDEEKYPDTTNSRRFVVGEINLHGFVAPIVLSTLVLAYPPKAEIIIQHMDRLTSVLTNDFGVKF